MSPYFAEDIANSAFPAQWLRSIGQRQTKAFSNIRFDQTIDALPSRTTFFYGDLELQQWPDTSYRPSIINRIPTMREVRIPNTAHDVTSAAYNDAIKDQLVS